MAESHDPIQLNAQPLSIAEVERVAWEGVAVAIGSEAEARLRSARGVVEDALSDGEAHYGINTGFGSLSRQRIDAAKLADLQSNLVRSHAAGVGEPLERDATRAMMLLLAASLCRGASGVRAEVPKLLADLLNAGITPVVPSLGSVGASGDLAPLAHLALVLIGEGEAQVDSGDGCGDSSVIPGGEALQQAGLTPLSLEAKEGLALINGTHLMAARGALACADAERVFDAALLACAMSIDGSRGTDSFLDPRVHELRNQPGPAEVARTLLAHLAGSEIIESHAENDPRVQDPYSLRCAPPVLGGALDCLRYVKHAVEAELGGVTDNPLVFEAEPRIVSAGNFHGMPLAIPLDCMTIAIGHLAGIAERRIFWMLSGRDPESGLRPYLAAQPGLQSGLMIAQYTAAALCNEIITLSTPASVSNIPTSAGTEDYNSFGPRSAAKAARAIELARRVVAIELVCAAEAIENHRPLRSGKAVERAHALVREVVPPLDHDRPPSPDIERIAERIKNGDFSARG